jgi:hypothetical protein
MEENRLRQEKKEEVLGNYSVLMTYRIASEAEIEEEK